MSPGAIALLILPIIVPVLIGWLLAVSGLVDRSAAKPLTTIFMYVCVPALIVKLLANEELDQLFEWRVGVAISLSYLLLWALVFAIQRFALRRDAATSAFAALTGSVMNAVVLGLPVLLTLFGHRAVTPVLIAVAAYLVVITPLTLTVAGSPSGESSSGPFRTVARGLMQAARNPMVIATVVGLVISASGVTLPPIVLKILETLGNAAATIALVAIGLTIVIREIRLGGVETVWMTLIVLVVAPALVAGVALGLQLSHVGAAIIVILFAMPPAQSVYGLCAQYDTYDRKAAAILALSTIGLVVMLPLLIAVLDHVWPKAFSHLHAS